MADQPEVNRLNLLIRQANNAIYASRLLDELRIERRVLMARLEAVEQESFREADAIQRNFLLILGAQIRLDAIADEQDEKVIWIDF